MQISIIVLKKSEISSFETEKDHEFYMSGAEKFCWFYLSDTKSEFLLSKITKNLKFGQSVIKSICEFHQSVAEKNYKFY